MSLVERLRAALAHPAPPTLLAGDLVEGGASASRPAAVLVAATDRPQPGVLLTVRREHLRNHAGQVAFPGGRVDPEDTDVQAAALREAEEELGLPRSAVTVLGTADTYRTITGYLVTPVLATIPADLPLDPHEAEVADWFEAPLAFLLDPSNQRAVEMEYRGRMRTYYQIDWQSYRIWGATAAMLVNLTRRLQAWS